MISAVIGLQYGDQGKGKFVDYLSQKYDCSIRFNGSNNAGHSVSVGQKNYAVHLVPSGIFHNKQCLVANQCVLDPISFCEQLDYIKQNGFDQNLIHIGSRVSLICPFHKQLDQYFEQTSNIKLGTTKRGVGPAYSDKASRIALRMQDSLLTKEQLMLKYNNCSSRHNNHLKSIQKEDFEMFYSCLQRLKSKMVDVTSYMGDILNKNILFQGAQSTQLDLTWGEYPYVTSSSCLAQNAMISVGRMFKFDKIYGVFKAYTTRVGTGPFITQMDKQIDEKTRQLGHQFGVTTGRPRKCGWLDLVSLKRSCILNGVTDLCLVKSDIFNNYPYINVCSAYYTKDSDSMICRYPYTEQFKNLKPIYSTFKGWKDLNDKSFKGFVDFIESFTNVNIKYISFSPRRQDVIVNHE